MIGAALVFVPPAVVGVLLTHLLWPSRDFRSVALKVFLGAGMGLGLQSVLYFLYLLAFAGQSWFIVLELAILVVLLAAVLATELRNGEPRAGTPLSIHIEPSSAVLVLASLIVLLVSLFSTANYLVRRRQGDWDAWMMYNRAARFIYIDQSNWLESFSARMDPIFHADYPLLLADNIASAWQTLGSETARVPMLQSLYFSVALLGLMVTALAALKSIGQAALGLVVLWGVPVFVNEGARQMADVPVAFFLLAVAVLLFLFTLHRKPGLLALAGLCAGCAAWTKNEGAAIVVGAILALVVALGRDRPWKPFASFGAGIAVPLLVLLYFKLRLAPPGDLLSAGPARWIQQAVDPSRHFEILNTFLQEFLHFGAWGSGLLSFGILPILLLFALLFHEKVLPQHRPALLAGLALLIVQSLGYYAAYVITPYNLSWHLSFSATRLVIQVFPLILFLLLCASMPMETVFASGNTAGPGVKNAARN